MLRARDPDPVPDPVPREEETIHTSNRVPETPETAVQFRLVPETPKPPSDVETVCEYWRTRSYHLGRVQVTKDRIARVKARLAEGYSAQDLRDAIDGAELDDWLMGRNPKTSGKTYRGLETILRDAGQLERLRELWREKGWPERDRPRPSAPPKRPELIAHRLTEGATLASALEGIGKAEGA